MVKSQALILVPISKLVCLAQAFMTVSCTRSSALSCLPVSETAKARKLGSVASISRLNDVCSVAIRSFPFLSRKLGALSLLGIIELLQQVQELVRHAFVLDSAIEGTQFRADVGIDTKPVICTPCQRPHALL